MRGHVRALLRHPILELLEARAETADGAAQRLLRTDPDPGGEPAEREQQIAHLLLDVFGVAGGDGLVELAELLRHLGAHAGEVGPIEANLGRLLADPLGAQERRQVGGHSVERAPDLALALMLGGFELGPVLERLVRVLDPHIAEHVGVAADHLLADSLDHVVDAEAALARPELGLKQDLKQQVPELLAVLGRVIAVNGLQDLVGLLDQVGLEGLEGLLVVPGTAVGGQQPLHDLDQFRKVLALLRDCHDS